MSDLRTAGPALDVEVCRVVFGLEIETEKLPSGAMAYGVRATPSYSADTEQGWAAMRRLLLRMQELGWHARLTTPFEAGERWFCGFTPHGMTGWNGRPDHDAGAESLPLAACLAALKAVTAGVNGPLSEAVS